MLEGCFKEKKKKEKKRDFYFFLSLKEKKKIGNSTWETLHEQERLD